MAKLTLEDLRKLREAKKVEIEKRETEGKDIEVIVGMGTCGIAAGAKEAVDAFLDEIDKLGIKNVIVKQTGCMGFCTTEPTVEVRVPDMPATIYGNVKADVARKIVNVHLQHKRLVSDYVFDRPSIDIIKK
jgi:NADP-reducing hydrogenase subunit HndB